MATYKTAFQTFLYRPIDLTPADIEALKARDPSLAKAAVKAWAAALRSQEYKRRGELPVVRLDRSK
jgi:hypothetical protein